MVLVLLVALKLNGSSMGSYYSYFYGTAKDPSLVAGTPRAIRSDEWVVNTQMTLAQNQDDYRRVNANIGNGEDMSVIIDVPYKEWSTVFRPHNLGFFVLPFEYAFALKWWLMGYFLVLACYFFVINVLPGRRLIASLLALCLFFSSFIQWWYQYITLGPVYYALAIMALFLILNRAKSLRLKIATGGAISYLLVCFALVQYPPFQVPCAIVMALFCLGELLKTFSKNRRVFWHTVATLAGASFVAGLVTFAFLHSRSGVIDTIQNTAYPGQRMTVSGGYDIYHFLSGNYAFLSQFGSKIIHYTPMNPGMWNQSELSNFIYVSLFLTIPAIVILYRTFRKSRTVDPTILLLFCCFLLFLSWLFLPHLPSFVGKVTLLERVPTNRLLIGFGLLNVVFLAQFAKLYLAEKRPPKQWLILAYALAVFIAQLVIGLHNLHRYPGFVTMPFVIIFSLIIPVVIWLILQKKIVPGLAVLFAFSLISTAAVNPVYRGTAVLSDNPLVKQITAIHRSDEKGRWIIENGFLENFALISGAPSVSGVYTYPQLDLWRQLDHPKQESLYNRYAHVTITLNRSSETAGPVLESPAADHFGVGIGACSPFLAKENVHYVVTEVPLVSRCAKQINTTRLADRTVFIYRLDPSL